MSADLPRDFLRTDHLQKGILPMKTAKAMYSIICMLFFSLFSAACAGSNIREIKKAVSAELEPLKELDSDTAYAYLQQSGLLDSLVTDSDDSFLQELKDVLSMFFKQFDYKIRNQRRQCIICINNMASGSKGCSNSWILILV